MIYYTVTYNMFDEGKQNTFVLTATPTSGGRFLQRNTNSDHRHDRDRPVPETSDKVHVIFFYLCLRETFNICSLPRLSRNIFQNNLPCCQGLGQKKIGETRWKMSSNKIVRPKDEHTSCAT